MDFHFVATKNLEPWDWRSPDLRGIGNSETSQIEMAARLSLRGHRVTSYSWLPPDTPDGTIDPRGVVWRQLESATFTEPGIWILYRCPDLIDRFTDEHPNQTIWLMMQDTHYDNATPERAPKLDRVLVLCNAQRDFIANRFPDLADKLVVTSNGVRLDMIQSVESECVGCQLPFEECRKHAKLPVGQSRYGDGHDDTSHAYLSRHVMTPYERNPLRLHFSSSPDRGLKVLLEKIFPKSREYVPDLELHVYYGWNNIEKLMETEDGKRFFGPNKTETEKLLKQPGVVWHGRVGQRELTREWLKAGLWVFPSMYPETSCATCMEAQALGAIPISSGLWALGENIHYGVRIDGEVYTDALVQTRYAAEIVRLTADPARQESFRAEMMTTAREQWSWERWVDQWEALAFKTPAPTIGGSIAMVRGDQAFAVAQAWFQAKHASGDTLNVGCSSGHLATDAPVTNLDLNRVNPSMGSETVCDVQADARSLPYQNDSFETVILGDLLEHMSDADAIITLREAARVTRDKIIVTWPVDTRTSQEQHVGHLPDYAPGIPATHTKTVEKSDMLVWCQEAGLIVTHLEEIEYPFAPGFGLILQQSGREAGRDA